CLVTATAASHSEPAANKRQPAMTDRRYRNYLLVVLTGILIVNYVDRLALGIMLQDIKGAMHLSDTQLGLISGLAFAILHALAGIPLARWADRGDRVTIISLAT